MASISYSWGMSRAIVSAITCRESMVVFPESYLYAAYIDVAREVTTWALVLTSDHSDLISGEFGRKIAWICALSMSVDWNKSSASSLALCGICQYH